MTRTFTLFPCLTARGLATAGAVGVAKMRENAYIEAKSICDQNSLSAVIQALWEEPLCLPGRVSPLRRFLTTWNVGFRWQIFWTTFLPFLKRKLSPYSN